MTFITQIADEEFALFQRLIYKIAGISLNDSKKVLLVGRLGRRLSQYGMNSFSQYYRMLSSGENPEELQTMVDLLTTNETYFFREPRHFDFLREEILRKKVAGAPFRIWSAASSTGEEVYTLAMVLAENLGEAPWEIVGSDICTRVLERAASGHYSLARTEGIPPAFMKKYCLKGVRSQAGTFLIVPKLRERASFFQINLMHTVDAAIGDFDVIFLRNVMIYFDHETKAKVIDNILPRLKSNGYLVIGHSESLNGITNRVTQVAPTIYRKI